MCCNMLRRFVWMHRHDKRVLWMSWLPYGAVRTKFT